MISLVLIALLSFSFSFSFDDPLVQIEDGLISGTYFPLPSNRKVNAFYGIPYAAPPLFENRFRVRSFI